MPYDQTNTITTRRRMRFFIKRINDPASSPLGTQSMWASEVWWSNIGLAKLNTDINYA